MDRGNVSLFVGSSSEGEASVDSSPRQSFGGDPAENDGVEPIFLMPDLQEENESPEIVEAVLQVVQTSSLELSEKPAEATHRNFEKSTIGYILGSLDTANGGDKHEPNIEPQTSDVTANTPLEHESRRLDTLNAGPEENTSIGESDIPEKVNKDEDSDNPNEETEIPVDTHESETKNDSEGQTEESNGINESNDVPNEPNNSIGPNEATNGSNDSNISNVSNSEPSNSSSRKRQLEPIEDPGSFKLIKSKKKIPRKVIEKLWQPLTPDTVDDIKKIFDMCINQCILTYGTKGAFFEPSKKMIDSQAILLEDWLSESNTESFVSRMKVTNFPGANMRSRSSVLTLEMLSGDLFSIDKLMRRKKMIEAHLLADIKQLNELKKNYNSLNIVCQQDRQYLEQLRKSTSKIQERMVRQSETIRKKIAISSNEATEFDKKIRLKSTRPKSGFKFDPSKDTDTSMIMKSLCEQIDRLKAQTDRMVDVDNGLEDLLGKLAQ